MGFVTDDLKVPINDLISDRDGRGSDVRALQYSLFSSTFRVLEHGVLDLSDCKGYDGADGPQWRVSR